MTAGRRLGIVLLCAGCSAPAWAAPYFGGGVLSSEYQYDDVGHGTGHRYFAGWAQDQSPLMFEVGGVDFGDAEIDSVDGLSIGFAGWQASVGYFARVPNSGSGFFFRGGYYDGDAKIELDGDKAEVASSGGLIGGGGVWMITPYVGLRFDLDVYFNVKDFANLDAESESNATTASLSLQFALPSGMFASAAPPAPGWASPTQAAPAQPAPMSASPYPHPAPQSGAPAQTQTSQPPAPAAAASPQRVFAQPGTQLRDRPLVSAPARSVAAGTELHITSRITNQDGNWWYVSAATANGWIPATN